MTAKRRKSKQRPMCDCLNSNSNRKQFSAGLETTEAQMAVNAHHNVCARARTHKPQGREEKHVRCQSRPGKNKMPSA
eukprot:7123691-Alexandrium_andersonii.AAC.1